MARSFNGSAQYLSAASVPVSSKPLTIACWFNSSDITNNQTLVQLAATSGTHRYELLARGGVGGDPVTCLEIGGTTRLANTTTGYSASTWHHACAVFSTGTSRSVYIDGGSKATDTNSIISDPASIAQTVIGYNLLIGVNSTTGRIAEVGIWNVALSDADVAALATGVSPLLVRGDALVGGSYWRLLGYSPEIDICGGIDLTATGATVGDHCRIVYPPGGRPESETIAVFLSGASVARLDATSAAFPLVDHSGTSTSQLDATAAATPLVDCSGTAAAQLDATAAAVTLVDLAGTIASQLDATGAATTMVDLAGAINSQLDATVSAVSLVDLTGTAASQLDATAAAAALVDLAGQIDAQLDASLAGALVVELTGTVAAVLNATAAGIVLVDCGGTSDAVLVATAIAELTGDAPATIGSAWCTEAAQGYRNGARKAQGYRNGATAAQGYRSGCKAAQGYVSGAESWQGYTSGAEAAQGMCHV